jgi:hypothetical protein
MGRDEVYHTPSNNVRIFSVTPPTIVEGRFEAENPVNILIGRSERFPWRIGGSCMRRGT